MYRRATSIALALVLASTPARTRGEHDSASVVFHGPRAERRVALTFDACSTRKPGGVDAGVLRVLRDTRTPATLFLGGRWMRFHADVVRRLAADTLFELANHSDTHPHFPLCSDQAIASELERTQAVLRSLTGRTAALFRPPYGEYDERTVRIARTLGLTTVLYDLPSGDPDSSATADRLADYVGRKARNGSIVVFHLNGRGWHTAEALPRVIARLRSRGYTLVKVSDFLLH